jgi:hypothetical protein
MKIAEEKKKMQIKLKKKKKAIQTLVLYENKKEYLQNVRVSFIIKEIIYSLVNSTEM